MDRENPRSPHTHACRALQEADGPGSPLDLGCGAPVVVGLRAAAVATWREAFRCAHTEASMGADAEAALLLASRRRGGGQVEQRGLRAWQQRVELSARVGEPTPPWPGLLDS